MDLDLENRENGKEAKILPREGLSHIVGIWINRNVRY